MRPTPPIHPHEPPKAAATPDGPPRPSRLVTVLLLALSAIAGLGAVATEPGRLLSPSEPKARLVAPTAEYAEAAGAELAVIDDHVAEAPTPAPERLVWDELADCESGDWAGGGEPIEGSARWSSAVGHFEGGLQFAPSTWDAFRDPAMPASAYDATRGAQILVAQRVLDAQGWGAWPACSSKLGLR